MQNIRVDLTKKYKQEFEFLEKKKNLSSKIDIVHHVFKDVLTKSLSEKDENIYTCRVKIKPSLYFAYYKYPKITADTTKTIVKSMILNIRQAQKFADENNSAFPPFLNFYIHTPDSVHESINIKMNIPMQIKYMLNFYKELRRAEAESGIKCLVTIAYQNKPKEFLYFSKFLRATGINAFYGTHDQCLHEIKTNAKEIFTTM